MSRGICSAAVGFLAAAVFPTLVLSVSMPSSWGYQLEDILTAPVVYFPFAVAAVVVLGVPTFLVLRLFGTGRWWIAVIAGLILGIPLLLALPGQPDLGTALIFVPLTALSALFFWMVWRW